MIETRRKELREENVWERKRTPAHTKIQSVYTSIASTDFIHNQRFSLSIWNRLIHETHTDTHHEHRNQAIHSVIQPSIHARLVQVEYCRQIHSRKKWIVFLALPWPKWINSIEEFVGCVCLCRRAASYSKNEYQTYPLWFTTNAPRLDSPKCSFAIFTRIHR